jgi:glycosyltransferase involved in cell wall biosynthesis
MFKSRRLLHRLRRENQIDLIHQLNPVNKGLSLAVLGSGLPVVLGVVVPSWPLNAEDGAPKKTLAKHLSVAFKMWVKRRLLTIQQWQASVLLLVSPAARDELHHAERVECKIVHLPIGVNTTQFSPSVEIEPDQSQNVPNILFLANLWRRKGIFTLLDAFAQVVEKVPTCRLTIAGGGSEQEEVERVVAASPHRDQITMLGAISRAQVPNLMRSCTVYCLPSYGEPFGIGALEAMASGKPVVATNAGGIKEMIPDGGGRKVPPRDAGALAAALIEIVSSPKLQAEMGHCNRQKIEQFYAWDRVIDRLENVYEQVVAAQDQPQEAQSLQIY